MDESKNEHANKMNEPSPIDTALMHDKENLEWMAAYYASHGFVQHAHEIYRMLRSRGTKNGDSAQSA
ncbi:MAG TPA: hypothetical protein V6C81_16290 [Planktothrix sp.]|jgi:beta-xylosidase